MEPGGSRWAWQPSIRSGGGEETPRRWQPNRTSRMKATKASTLWSLCTGPADGRAGPKKRFPPLPF